MMRPHAADHVPALHNCGPAPGSVYRTAPAGAVHALDLFPELCSNPLIAEPLRLRFERALTRHRNGPGHVADSTGPHCTTGDVVELVETVLALLPRGRGTLASCDAGESVPTLVERPVRGAAQRSVVTEQDALAAVQRLAEHLRAYGRLAPPHALVQWVPRSRYGVLGSAATTTQSMPWLAVPRGKYARPTRLAWLLCAYTYAAPPLVLFTRPPSLRWWRADGLLSLRWLGAPRGGE